MADRIFIYSTLTAPQEYTNYAEVDLKNTIQIPAVVESVHIEGGANVADSRQVTLRGVRTEITEDQYDILKRNASFNEHVKRQFITVRFDKVDPEVAAADMKQKDDSSPLTPNDYINLVGQVGAAIPQGVGK